VILARPQLDPSLYGGGSGAKHRSLGPPGPFPLESLSLIDIIGWRLGPARAGPARAGPSAERNGKDISTLLRTVTPHPLARLTRMHTHHPQYM
jgi:hypothetical protein